VRGRSLAESTYYRVWRNARVEILSAEEAAIPWSEAMRPPARCGRRLLMIV